MPPSGDSRTAAHPHAMHRQEMEPPPGGCRRADGVRRMRIKAGEAWPGIRRLKAAKPSRCPKAACRLTTPLQTLGSALGSSNVCPLQYRYLRSADVSDRL